MDEPKPLDSLFKEKLFRIPDYQRGYAWGREQLEAFWEDLINLPKGRSHYTGVLTLKLIPSADIQLDSKEFWLVDDHSYLLYHIVDGQQRPYNERAEKHPCSEGQKVSPTSPGFPVFGNVQLSAIFPAGLLGFLGLG